MMSLRDWTSYVFAGIVVAAGLSVLWYEINFDVFKTDEPATDQFSEPEIRSGTWRLGHLPSRGAELKAGMFAVFKVRGCGEVLHVARIVATEGQRVEVRDDKVLVDGNPIPNPTKSARSRWDVPEIVVPRGCVFVLCDQRQKTGSAEYDSRRFGPIPVEAITHCFKPLKGS